MHNFLYNFIFLVIVFTNYNRAFAKNFISEWFSGMEYCSPLRDGAKCAKMKKQWNFYNAVIGGPIVLFDVKNFDGFSAGGGTSDFAFGIQTRNNNTTISFEAKIFNQFFLVDSSKIGASRDFNLDANLHGVQFKLIYGKLIGKELKWKPYAFLAFDVGGGRLKAIFNNIETRVVAPTIGGAIAVGIDYQLNNFLDVGLECPFGVTVLMRSNGNPAVFPDVYPNLSIKIHY